MFLPNCLRSTRASASVAALFAGAVFLAQAVSLPAQPAPSAKDPDRAHIEEVLNGINRARSVGQVAVSPDRKHLAWIEGCLLYTSDVYKRQPRYEAEDRRLLQR